MSGHVWIFKKYADQREINYKGNFAAELIRSSLINKKEKVLAAKLTYSGINTIECDCNSPSCSLSIMIGHTIHMPQNKTLFFIKKRRL